MNKSIVNFIRDIYQTEDFVPLHAPTFSGNEKSYVLKTIESTFVSSVGEYVNQFESMLEAFTKSEKAVATVNGTSALHIALHMAGVCHRDLVITQALTFVATCNSIHHMGAEPLFIDISKTSLGLCPRALEEYLVEHAILNDDGVCIHNDTGQTIRAAVPMHTFGHPAELDKLMDVCGKWNICLIEDAAESLGSYYKGRHTGTIGRYSALSFNGNKIITTGGGGALLCSSLDDGTKAKHLTTTAKVPHEYEFFHDEAGFNYRMPNINAALGCAQLEKLPQFLEQKRTLADRYKLFFEDSEFEFVKEPEYAKSNYWLNALICPSKKAKFEFLDYTNSNGIMTRPVWTLMHRLPAYADKLCGPLPNSEWAEQHLVNIPSSPVS